MQCAGLFCVDIYELCLELGVHYLLAAVQAEVAREHIGYAAGEREIHNVSRAEELNAQDDGCDGAVDRAAEHTDKPERRGKARRNAEERAEDAAERRDDEEGRDDFDAPVAEAL